MKTTNTSGAIVATIFAVVSFGCATTVKTPHSSNPNADYVDTFYDEKNIDNYIEVIDSLIANGQEYVFESLTDMESKPERMSSATTTSGIKLVYTIYKVDGALVHHMSSSRSPFFPTNFAAAFSSLFSLRSGLPILVTIYSRNNVVYHSIWKIENEKFDEFRKQTEKKNRNYTDSISNKDVFFEAVSQSNKIEVVR